MNRTASIGLDLAWKKVLRDGPAGWMVLLFFLPIIRNTILVRQRADVSGYTGIDFWAVLDITSLCLCGWALLCNLGQIPWKKLCRSCYFWWLLYYVFASLSIFWRLEGSSIVYILYRSFSMLLMSLYLFWLISLYRSAESAFAGILKYTWWIMLLGVVGTVRFGGLHTNTYSFTAASLVVLAYAGYKVGLYPPGKVFGYILSGSVCLILGTSGGSNVAFVCGMFFILSLTGCSINWVWFVMLCIAVLLVYLCFFEDLLAILFPGKNPEGIASGTGRFRMWEIYWEAWKLRPWLGWGFAVGERSGEQFGYIYTLSAHNGFISLLINTGIAGCLIWGRFFFGLCLGLFYQMRKGMPYAFPVFAMLIVSCVNNLSVPIIGSIWGTLSTSVLMVISFYVLFIQYGEKESSGDAV